MAAIGCTFTPHFAAAYRTAAELPEIQSQSPVAWPTAEIEFDVYSGASAALATTAQVGALGRALGSWQAATCDKIALRFANTAAQPAYPNDHRNTLMLVESGWTELGFEADAAAFTDILYDDDHGKGWRILEADIYVNAETFHWVESGGGDDRDHPRGLEAVLLHEVGHALGLIHPCEERSVAGVPSCASDDAYATTAMYPIYESSKIALSDDDVAGLCSIYDCPVDCRASDGSGGAPPGETDSAAGGSEPAICESKVCQEATDLGVTCDSAADCMGAVCVAGAEQHAICSRPCQVDDCGQGWSCTKVEERNVCVPQQLQAGGGGGCTLAGAALPRRVGGEAWLAVGAFGLGMLRRRRT